MYPDAIFEDSEAPVAVKKVKPRVLIRNAKFDRDPWGRYKILTGIPIDHPNLRLNGKFIFTSRVLNHDELTVETNNTMYVICEWAKTHGT